MINADTETTLINLLILLTTSNSINFSNFYKLLENTNLPLRTVINFLKESINSNQINLDVYFKISQKPNLSTRLSMMDLPGSGLHILPFDRKNLNLLISKINHQNNEFYIETLEDKITILDSLDLFKSYKDIFVTFTSNLDLLKFSSKIKVERLSFFYECKNKKKYLIYISNIITKSESVNGPLIFSEKKYIVIDEMIKAIKNNKTFIDIENLFKRFKLKENIKKREVIDRESSTTRLIARINMDFREHFNLNDNILDYSISQKIIRIQCPNFRPK